ncbi:MAG TPA: amidohydrolase family protein [Acidimicrobiia bacterium]|nr:amidohydrolase family protein [Acidimicrobiia bacterium]
MTIRTSAEIRRDVGHPIVDADGHVLEVLDATYPYVREALGPALFEQWRERGPLARVSQRPRTLDERRRTRTPQGSWWGGPPASNACDRATATLPALLHERMDELGIDFAVLYPTNTLLTCAEVDEELRRGLCRGFNEYYADVYLPYSDRMTIAGMIPMHTPEEAVAELHHCAELGLKTILLPEGVLRPLDEPATIDGSPWLWPGQTHWFDSFGLDSVFDYDPVWQACRDLGFVAAFHGGMTVRPGLHWSITSYVANHVGQFAAEMYPLCKALLFGGVTARFPDLQFAFLECGVSWAMQMLCDTVEHWEKRNVDALPSMDPATLDRDELARYFAKYGGRITELIDVDPYEYVQRLPIHGSTPEERDEFVHLRVRTAAELVERFAGSFSFGCEADDRGITTAFSPAVPEGATLRAMFSSDIGHWDVPDMAHVVAESFELVEDGLLTPGQWRQVVCDNPVEMYRRANPDFFAGTTLEGYRP